jgi:hypothetical protein
MGKSYDGITPELSTWIERQRIFFTATAPLSGDGLINCSPKGLDTFRIYGVPRFTCAGDRDALVRWCAAKGPERLSQYQRDNNARSLDGLPGLGTAAGDR